MSRNIISMIEEIVSNDRSDTLDIDKDSIEKLIYIAYQMGLCDGTIRTSNAYNAVLKAQKERAEKCRYRKMAMDVQGDISFVYTANYDNWVRECFADDETEIDPSYTVELPFA